MSIKLLQQRRDAARGGVEPAEEGVASEPQEIRHPRLASTVAWELLRGAKEGYLGLGEDGMDEPRATDSTNAWNPIAARGTRPEEGCGGGDLFAAPLGSSRSGRLRFSNGAHRVSIRSDVHMRALCHARFGDRMPMVGVRGGVVTIRYPRVPSCDWLGQQSECPAELALNARVPWDIEVRGGASNLVADLRELRLGALSLDGGASRLEVVLPTPSSTVTVVVLGGASNVVIRRPNGVATRLRVSGGVTSLRFDDRRIGAAGGELDLRDRDYDGATDRYDVAVSGGANNVSIDKQ